MNQAVRFISGLFKVCVSILAVGALFVFVGVAAALIIPFITAETYTAMDTPHTQFRVVVVVQDPRRNVPVPRMVRWDDFVALRATGNYEVYRSQAEGACTDTPFWCQAKNLESNRQLVELRYGQENFYLFNRYYVAGDQMQPVYCRITDRGHAMMGGLLSLVITPISLVFFRYGVKRYKRHRAERASPSP